MMVNRIIRASRRQTVHAPTEHEHVQRAMEKQLRAQFGFTINDLKAAHREGATAAGSTSPHVKGSAMDYFWKAGQSGKSWEQAASGQ